MYWGVNEGRFGPVVLCKAPVFVGPGEKGGYRGTMAGLREDLLGVCGHKGHLLSNERISIKLRFWDVCAC